MSNGCKDTSPGNSIEPVSVSVTPVQKGLVSYYDDYPGTIVALNEVELRSEVSGMVTGIFFRDGEYVRKGRRLYEIDRIRYLASFEQAKANVEIAMANVERAQRYVDRYTVLSEQDAIARQRLDDARTDLQNANLSLVSAKAGLVRTQSELNYSLIVAPFDGTIGISKVKLGSLVIPGQTLMNTISTDDPMGVDFVVNEKEIGRFQELSTEKVPAGDSTFRIFLPDQSVYAGEGRIQAIDRAIDPGTGTIRIRLEFGNEQRKLRAGMSCNVKVLHGGKEEDLVIPTQSLLEQMSEYYVYVVDSQKARQVKVIPGAQLEGKVVVTGKLEEGQLVVTDGVQKLRDGMPVITETGSSAGSAQ